MLNIPPEELLSAYLDGELSPDETQHVERLLAEDALLREQLAELKDLSLSIRQIPRISAPANLQASVLSALERIAPTHVANKTVVPLVNHRRKSRRFWPGAAAVCVVVGLLVGSIVLPQIHQKQSVETDYQLAMTSQATGRLQEMSTPELFHTTPPTDTSLAARAMTMKSAAPSVAPAAAPASALNADGVNPAPAPVVKQLVVKGRQKAQAEPSVAVVELTGEQIRQKIVEVGRLPVSGNSIQVPSQITTENGLTPIIVEFTVVDAKLAVNQLEVLVKKQQVRTLDNQVLARQSGSGSDTPLSTISVELELDGAEMATVLNQVPALDAVLYLPEATPLPEAEMLLGDVQNKKEISRAAIPANPKFGSERSVAQKSADRRQFEQPVQFRFEQLTQTQTPRGNQSQEMSKPTQLGINSAAPFDATPQPLSVTTSDKLIPQGLEAQGKQVPSITQSQSQSLVKTASPRYHAIILLQQTK